jgi:hypothetical protein
MVKQHPGTNHFVIGRAALAALFAVAPAMLAGCATTGVPTPSDARTISCTTPGRDCSQEADQICPTGYRTLEKQSYSSESEQSSSNPGEPNVTHTTLVIECTSSI